MICIAAKHILGVPAKNLAIMFKHKCSVCGCTPGNALLKQSQAYKRYLQCYACEDINNKLYRLYGSKYDYVLPELKELARKVK